MVEVTLGKTYRDSITGLVGVAVSRTVWLSGCVRVALQPQEIKDGVPAAEFYVDEDRLVEMPAQEEFAPSAARVGGERPNPQRSADPRR